MYTRICEGVYTPISQADTCTFVLYIFISCSFPHVCRTATDASGKFEQPAPMRIAVTVHSAWSMSGTSDSSMITKAQVRWKEKERDSIRRVDGERGQETEPQRVCARGRTYVREKESEQMFTSDVGMCEEVCCDKIIV